MHIYALATLISLWVSAIGTLAGTLNKEDLQQGQKKNEMPDQSGCM